MYLYMMIYVINDENGIEQNAMFGNDYYQILKSKMDIECGLGGYCEIYKRMEGEDGMEYVFQEA